MNSDSIVGGAATNKGIWYQALWCVLQATAARIETFGHPSPADRVQLVLEPFGGDAIVQRPGGRRIVQLKTLAHGTWSLKDVVEQVLPDLYRAVEVRDADATYEFVTEGRFGQWEPVRRFFEPLAGRLAVGASEADFQKAYMELDDRAPLRFGGSDGDFWVGRRTGRGVFDRIVEHLRAVTPARDEAIEQTRRKAWHLLSRFRFCGAQDEESVRERLDKLLVPVVDDRSRLSTVRDAMVGWLIDKSRQNETTITPEQLFEARGLKYVVPITHWALAEERCRQRVQRAVELRGYRPEWDVRPRPTCVEGTATPVSPFIIVTGESGRGKSWGVYAEALAAADTLAVMLDSGGDAEADLQRAANEVWQGALGHENALSLRALAERRADVCGAPAQALWLSVCFDRLRDVDCARALLLNPIEDWGVRIVVECDAPTAAVFAEHERDHPGRVRIVRMNRFTSSQRDTYFFGRLGDHWADVPPDVRELLRIPQLASIYCDLASEIGGWRPRNEYELVERYWRRVTDSAHPNDALGLQHLARMVLEGKPYPWDLEQLRAAEVDDEAAGRLISAGWLRRAVDQRYEVPHDRLLNFAVAQALAADHRHERKDDDRVADLLAPLLGHNAHVGQVWLPYVPMDWAFLRSRYDQAAVSRVLTCMGDRLDVLTREAFYRDLLPTLETLAVPLLFGQLIAFAEADRWWELQAVVDGLATRPTVELRDRMLELLKDVRPQVQRAGLKLLARRPLPEELDRVWKLHVRLQTDPLPCSAEPAQSEEMRRLTLYKDSFGALRECARAAPSWVAAAIQRCDSATEPVSDLAYLTANLDDGGETWRTCKTMLHEKVPVGKRRSLALNMGTWRDASETAWLESLVGIEDDFLGPAALRALAQIDPPRAAAALARAPERVLYFGRAWCLPRLFLVAESATCDALREFIRQAPNPLRAALVYQGSENEMDARTLEMLLDMLDAALARLLAEAEGADRAGLPAVLNWDSALHSPLGLLAGIGRRDLLEVFRSRRATLLEQRLADVLIKVGPRRDVWQDRLLRDPALNVLLKIAGDGYRQVVNAYLGTDNRFGRLDAIEASVHDADGETIRKLREIVVSEELWDKCPLLQMEAMKALAAHGDSTGVMLGAIRLGPHVPAAVEDWLRPGAETDAEAIDAAMRIVRGRESTQFPGALLGLGMLGHVEVMEDLVAVLEAPPNQDAQLGAIDGLGYLGAAASSAVRLVAQHLLSDPPLRRAAIVALDRIGTAEARRELLESLDERWDTSLAVWLAQFPEACGRAVDMLADRLRATAGRARVGWWDDLQTVLSEASDETLKKTLVAAPNICDRIREAAFATEGGGWRVGSKASAVRGLAVFDPYAARLAARKALEDVQAHDRHLYSAHLYRPDDAAARDVFLRVAARERNEAVVWSMAHGLTLEDAPWLLGEFSATSPDVRSAACRLSVGPIAADAAVQARLLELLDDPAERVARAAEAALELSERQRRSADLMDALDALGAEADVQAWVVLDAVLHVGPVGYERTAWPEWAERFYRSKAAEARPALTRVLEKRLSEKRKEALSEAERKAKEKR
jgi:hypothetical protein